jgi:hypothetical protein
MMRKRLAIAIIAIGTPFLAGPVACAEYDIDAAALAKALSAASVSLAQGLKASEREGQPISAKYELENGALQLSVYTMKGDKYSEVIVDHMSDSIKKAEPITDADDLKDAKQQAEALGKARLSLEQAVGAAIKSNSGYQAVSAVPMLSDGQPEASITLLKGEEIKKVTEKLN